jgi:hypothetical protein
MDGRRLVRMAGQSIVSLWNGQCANTISNTNKCSDAKGPDTRFPNSVSNDDENHQRHTILENIVPPRVERLLPVHAKDIKKGVQAATPRR